jgi:uncharacterized protein (TIGR03083 family)
MSADARHWIAVLRASHGKLADAVAALGPDRASDQSYCRDWSVAQVLSHLGSGAEISLLMLSGALGEGEPAGMEQFQPIWDQWNAKSPADQVADGLASDEKHIARLEALTDAELDGIKVSMFGMDLDAAGLVGLRLGEHALHTWDIAVTLDPAATVAPDAASLLVDTLGQLAARSATPGGLQRRLRVSTTSPVRHYMLDIGETVTLTPTDGDGIRPELALPAEALVRLVYGRLDPAHTPPVETRNVDLDELRQVFPGF